MQRYFVQKINDSLKVSENDYHHIKNVMRLKDGDKLIACFDNQSFLCRIHYTKDAYELIIESDISTDVELKKEVILYQALIKNDKFDLVIQKATELGASKIYPTIFERSIIKIDSSKEESKLDRYSKIMKEASEQSHRQVIPNIMSYIKVGDIKLDSDTLGLVAYENNDDFYSLYNSMIDIDKYNKIAIVIGPEGGFTDKEINSLISKGFRNVSLGKRILRSETAAIYSLSVISYYIENIK